MSNRTWVGEPSKPSPVNLDQILILDSGDSDNNKLVTLGSLPGTEFFGPWTASHDAGGFVLDNLLEISDINLNTILRFSSAGASAVNFIILSNAITTDSPFILATGTDANVDLTLIAKGTGTISLGSNLDAAGFNLLNFGFIESDAVNPATVGSIRFGNEERIAWRNAANDDNISIRVASSDTINFEINGPTAFRFNSTEFDTVGKPIVNVAYFESDAANPATVGAIRLGNTEFIAARNAANTQNGTLSFNASDDWVFTIAAAARFTITQGQIDLHDNTVVNATSYGFGGAAPASTIIIADANGIDYIVPSGDVHQFEVNSLDQLSIGENLIDFHGNILDNVNILTFDATNPAGSGTIRLGNTETIAWRNVGNTADATLALNASDDFVFTIAAAAQLTISETLIDAHGNSIDNVSFLNSADATSATVGAIRLGNGEFIGWRDSGDTAEGTLTFDASDDFVFNVAAGGRFAVSERGSRNVASRHQGAKGANVASPAGGILTLGTDGNVFDITGTNTINEITPTSWQAGSIIDLQFDGVLTVTNNSGGTNDILLADGANFTTAAGDVLTLFFNGTDWQEVSRSTGGGGGEFFGPWTANHDAGGFILEDLLEIADTNTNPIFRFASAGASAENFIEVINAVSGFGPTMLADGPTDGDVNLTIDTKGNGIVFFPRIASLDPANPATDGFLRLGNTETIAWRNSINTTNETLALNASDDFVFTIAGGARLTISNIEIDMHDNLVINAASYAFASPASTDTVISADAAGINYNVAGDDEHNFLVSSVAQFTIGDTILDVLGNTLDNVAILNSNAGIPASLGAIRLGNTESVAWRNNANTDDITIRATSSDTLVFDINTTTAFRFNNTEFDTVGKPVINALYLESDAAIPAADGVIRLGNIERIAWRNAGDTNEISIRVANTDNFIWRFNGSDQYELDANNFDFKGNNIDNFTFLRSDAVNPAGNGVIRIGNTESVAWRNNANTDDITNRVSNTDTFVWDINGTDEYSMSATAFDVLGNNIDNVNFLRSNATNPSTAGAIRLGNEQRLSWRNFANDNNIQMRVSTSDTLVFEYSGVTNFRFNETEFDTVGKPIVNVAYFESDAANPATVGAIRLGNAEIIAFRNAANTDNETLTLNASDDFVFTIAGSAQLSIAETTIDMHDNLVTNAASYAFGGTASPFTLITADSGGITYEVIVGDDHRFFVNGIVHVEISETDVDLTDNNLLMSGGFAELTEITAPAAPAANTGRIYVADDGGVTTPFFRDDTNIINLRRSKCLIAGGLNTNNISANDYSSWNPFTAPGGGFPGEAMSFGKDGILSEMYFTISTNTAGVAITFNFQSAEATDGNQTVTIPSNTTGTFVDTTNTDATTLGDVQAFRVDANAPGDGTFVLQAVGIYLTTDEA